MEREQACLAALNEARSAAGGSSAIARALDLTPQAVSQWRSVPAERVLDVEKISGVSRYRLRPDVFGLDPQSGEAA